MNLKEYEETKNILLQIIEPSPFKDKVYLVGGCLRQELFGDQEINDIDLYVDLVDGAKNFIEYLKQNLPDIITDLAFYKRSETYKFSIKGVVSKIEVSQPKPKKSSWSPARDFSSLERDAMRRDFTINAVYQQISPDWEIRDPLCNGINDIKNKVFHACNFDCFNDDPLRMLRAIRFKYEMGFEFRIPQEKSFYAPGMVELLSAISKERIMTEFIKILNLDSYKYAAKELINSKLMKAIFPAFIDNYYYNQRNKHHQYTLGGHLFRVFLGLPAKCSLEVKLAALLHDISKPYDYQESADGGRTYHGHEISSAKMAGDMLRELTFSEITIKKVQILIENHMRLKQHYSYDTHEYTGSSKYTRRLIREMGENLDDLLLLIEADNMAHSEEWDMPGQVDSFRERVKNLDEKRVMKSPVNGRDVMEYFGITTGSEVGKILRIIQDIWDEEPSDDKDILLKKAYERYQKD